MLKKIEVLQLQQLYEKYKSIHMVSFKTDFSRQTIRKYIHLNVDQGLACHAGHPQGKQRSFLVANHDAIKAIFLSCSCRTPVAVREIHKVFGVKVDHWALNRYLKEERFQ